MTATKIIAIDNRRKSVNFRFLKAELLSVPSLQKTPKIFNFTDFRRYARRVSEKILPSFGESEFQIAIRAVDEEAPNKLFSEKQIEFHFAIRSSLRNLRDKYLAEKQKEHVDAQVSGGSIANDSRLVSLWDLWTEEKVLAGLAKTTIRGDDTSRKHLFDRVQKSTASSSTATYPPILDPKFRLEDFDPKTTPKKIVKGFKDHGHKDHTLFNSIKTTKRFTKWLVKEDYLAGIGNWPAVREPDPISDPYSKEELKKLKTLCEEHYVKTNDKTWLRCWYVLRYTGCRRNELAQLKLEDFEFVSEKRGSGIIHKTKTRARNQPLLFSNAVLIDFLIKDKAERGPKEVYFLDNGEGGTRFEGLGQITRIFRELRDQIGSKVKQPIHAFRHAVANELFEATGDIYIVKELLRHKNIKTTQRYLNSARVKPVVEQGQALLGSDFVREARGGDVEIITLPKEIEDQIAVLEARLKILYSIRSNSITAQIEHNEPKLIN